MKEETRKKGLRYAPLICIGIVIGLCLASAFAAIMGVV